MSAIEEAAALVMRPVRSMISVLVGDDPPLELQLVGRVVLEAILIGVTVGLAGCLLLLGLDAVEDLVVNQLMGYPRLAAAGERHESALDGSSRLAQARR